jgi:Zn-dependent protease with chaperone function
MAVLPAALVALGVARRDRLALALGALLAIATSISAADALDLEPVWLLLVAGGAILVGIALALRRLFAARPDRVAAGFTDRPLFEPDGGRSFLELAAVLATMSPAPRPPGGERGFEGGGGEFGGGGASGKF